DNGSFAVDMQRLPHCAAVSPEARSPEVIAHHHDVISARPVLIRQKGSAHRWADTEHRKKRCGYARREHAHRFIKPGELKVEVVNKSHIFEDMAALANFEKLGNARIVPICSTCDALVEHDSTHGDQPFGIAIGKRTDECRVYEREDRDVAADSESEHQ